MDTNESTVCEIKEASSIQEKIWTIALYFIPGIVVTSVLFLFSKTLSASLGLSLWFTQILILTIFLFLFQIVIVVLNGRFIDNLNLKSLIISLGLKRTSVKNIVIAILWGAAAVIVLHFYMPVIGKPIYSYLQSVPWISMPDWHYQVCAKPSYTAIQMTALMIVMLGVNVFCEEVFFRGYLFRKTMFFGKWTWIVNGLLFIAYHVFQIPITYAIFPVGLIVSGYFAWRKDIYGVMIVHLIINMLLPRP
ncbi:MAG: hypothetical protein COV46_03555 [Deltaproteobacteria bacterium CG11_big_fil_rev_8_21_14_0_20_49_13]|nr:MAG: hypothetical protein COV46_03555 [Deltaproteobacteria bacterium CG11_big_fil_rev_8_21_14_0_20_49_13]